MEKDDSISEWAVVIMQVCIADAHLKPHTPNSVLQMMHPMHSYYDNTLTQLKSEILTV